MSEYFEELKTLPLDELLQLAHDYSIPLPPNVKKPETVAKYIVDGLTIQPAPREKEEEKDDSEPSLDTEERVLNEPRIKEFLDQNYPGAVLKINNIEKTWHVRIRGREDSGTLYMPFTRFTKCINLLF